MLCRQLPTAETYLPSCNKEKSNDDEPVYEMQPDNDPNQFHAGLDLKEYRDSIKQTTLQDYGIGNIHSDSDE